MSSHPQSTMINRTAASTTGFNVATVDDPADDSKNKSLRRSRSGCYTCRVRRKKCDETRPYCKACAKLGLKCDYKPPQWWISLEQRRVQKERIKGRIRQTKTMEKHGSLQEYMERIRALSLKPSAVTAEHDFNQPVMSEPCNPLATNPLMTPVTPYEFDIRATNPDLFFNTAPLMNSTMSFPAFNPIDQPQPYSTIPDFQSDINLSNYAAMTPIYSPAGSTGLVYPDRPLSSYVQTMIPVDENDRPLLNNFVDNVLRLVFPIVEAHQQGPARARDILASLQNNRSYLHCCLSSSAIHLKMSRGLVDQMDHDIMRHRYEAISQLCRTLTGGLSNEQILEATLAMIFYHCSVGEPDDYLPDIPWNAHFKAVANLVNKPDCSPTQFNVSMITWIDILGATVLGETPHFAHTYRTKHLSGTPSGLQQLMGCDDRIMYLISEIACLESLKLEGRLDDIAVCQHISALSAQLDWTETTAGTLDMPYSSSGFVQPEKLTNLITALFRTAARIYLYSLMPGFGLYDPNNITLVASIGEILQCLPAGPQGFDRALVWPLFIAGAHSVPYSGFRKILTDRIASLAYLGNFGSLGRMYRLLQELWKLSGDPLTSSSKNASGASRQGTNSGQQVVKQPIHWRELMRRNKWDYLFM